MCAISGPSFAREVARGLPCAVVLASEQPALAASLARELNSNRLRMYSNDDIAGVEVAGAAKNSFMKKCQAEAPQGGAAPAGEEKK